MADEHAVTAAAEHLAGEKAVGPRDLPEKPHVQISSWKKQGLKHSGGVCLKQPPQWAFDLNSHHGCDLLSVSDLTSSGNYCLSHVC